MLEKLSLIPAAMLVSGMVMAEDEVKQVEWEGEVELGLVSTSGNTETDTISAKAKISREQGKWRNAGKFSAFNTSDKTGTTAERYELTGQSDYKFSEREYVFGIINYEDDRFSGYDYRVSESIGYGRRVLDRPDMTLDLEMGPGARQSKLDDGNSDSEFMVRGAAKYLWNITKTSNFSENLTVEAGQDATISKSVTALSSKINGSLAMRLSYTMKHTTDVPPGIEKTDTETAVTLVYSY